MTELDCKGMTRRMYGLNFYMALVFASLISVLLDRNTHTHTQGEKKNLLPVKMGMMRAG